MKCNECGEVQIIKTGGCFGFRYYSCSCIEKSYFLGSSFANEVKESD